MTQRSERTVAADDGELPDAVAGQVAPVQAEDRACPSDSLSLSLSIYLSLSHSHSLYLSPSRSLNLSLPPSPPSPPLSFSRNSRASGPGGPRCPRGRCRGPVAGPRCARCTAVGKREEEGDGGREQAKKERKAGVQGPVDGHAAGARPVHGLAFISVEEIFFLGGGIEGGKGRKDETERETMRKCLCV
jgi:hypothetical protein